MSANTTNDPNVAGRETYARRWNVTAEVIRRWDPYAQLAGGAPADEFDREITLVVAQIPNIESIADAVSAISQIFSHSFEASLFGPKSCERVGADLFEALKTQGLLQ